MVLFDLYATDNFHRSQKSQQGRRSVPARLQRSRRLVGDFAATKSVAAKFKSDIHCNRSATSPRPKFKTIAEVAEESQLGFAVGRRLVGD